MRVIYKPTGQLGDIPDNKFDPNLFSTPSAQTNNTQTQTITGHTLQEITQALQQARAARDKAAIKSITDDYDREFQYQQAYKPKEDKAGIKKKEEYDKFAPILKELFNEYETVPQSQKGPGKSLVTTRLGFLFPEATTYQQGVKSLAGSIKSLVGEAGQLTNQDIARIVASFPDIGDTTQQVNIKRKRMNDIFKERFGTSLFGDEKTNIKESGRNPIIDYLLGGAMNVVQDVGTGIRSKMERPNLQKNEQMASQFEQEAMRTTDPQQKKTLLQQANNLRQSISGEAQDISKSFSPDVKQNPALRGLVAGGQIAATAELPGLVKGGIITLKNLPSKIFHGGANQARAEMAKNLTANTKPLIEAGDNYVRTIDPAASKIWEILKPAIKETTSVPELLKKLTYWGNKAYTKSGDKRAITEGLLKSHLYETGRELIKDQAPEIAKLTSQMAQGMKRGELLKWLGGGALSTAVGGASYAILGKILGQNQR